MSVLKRFLWGAIERFWRFQLVPMAWPAASPSPDTVTPCAPFQPLERRLLLAASLVADIGTSQISTNAFGQFTNLNGTLYFVDDDVTHGAELWKSDGTPAG